MRTHLTNTIALAAACSTGSKLSSRPSRSGSRRRKSALPEDWAALAPAFPLALASPSPFAAAAPLPKPVPSLQLRVLSSRNGARGSLTSALSSAAMVSSSGSTSSCSTPLTATGSASGGTRRKRLSWWDDYEDRKQKGAYTPLTMASSASDFDAHDCNSDDWEDTDDDEVRKSSGFEEMTIVEDGVAVRDLFLFSSFQDDVDGGGRRASSASSGHRRSSSAGSRRMFLAHLERQRSAVEAGRRTRLAVVGGGLGLFMLMCVLYALSWIAG